MHRDVSTTVSVDKNSADSPISIPHILAKDEYRMEARLSTLRRGSKNGNLTKRTASLKISVLSGLVVLLVAFSPTFAKSADFEILGGQLILSGEISWGDSDKFKIISDGLPPGTIIRLQSPGGAATDGMEIGRQIRASGFVTYANYGHCASACGLIWLGGVERWISASSRVGFHEIYIEDGDTKRTSGFGNALVGSYMNNLGYSDRAIIFATFMESEGMAWLPDLDPDEVDIDFRIGVPEPHIEAPSVTSDEVGLSASREPTVFPQTSLKSVDWNYEGPVEEAGDMYCRVHQSRGLSFMIQKSIDRLQIGFFELNLPRIASSDLRVHMRIDELYNYYSPGAVIDGLVNSSGVSIFTSTIDERYIDSLEVGRSLYLKVNFGESSTFTSKDYDMAYDLSGSKAALDWLYSCRSQIMR